MNEKKYRTYTKEFKLDALEMLRRSGKSAAQVERDLGITPGMLLKWKARYQIKEKNGEVELAPSDMAAAQAEIRRLQKELRIVEEERDILKKAVSIFSKLEE
jgi:transposase